MCKNFMMSNVSKLTEKQFLKLRRLCLETMAVSRDNDGFGYAAINAEGRVFGERFLDVKHVEFQFRKDKAAPEPFDASPIVIVPKDVPVGYVSLFEAETAATPKEYNYFGTYSKPIGGFLAHARLATSGISMLNTHPHCTDKFTLIHNGVVQNQGKVYNWKSTCDSEFLVTHLTHGGLEGMVKGVSGSYAIGALHNETGELLIAKDSTNLYACYVSEIESLVIATDDDQLKAIVKGMLWKSSKIRRLKDNHAWVFNRDGVLQSETPFTKSYSSTAKVYNYKGWKGASDDSQKQIDYWNRDADDRQPSVYEAARRVNRGGSGAIGLAVTTEADIHGANDKDEIALYNKCYRFTREGKDIGYKRWMSLTYYEQKYECRVYDRETGKEIYDLV